MIFDAVICAGPQHLHIAALAIKSLQLFSESGNIHVITAAGNFEHFQKLKRQGSPIKMIDEDKLIEGVNLGSFKEYFVKRGADHARAGWYFQQFLKMSVCYRPEIADYYLIWDSDTLMLRPLSFFDSEGRSLVNHSGKYHQPYFDLTEKLLGITRLVDFSFITEHMMINKQYMRQMIAEIEEKCCGEFWPFEILDLVKDNNLVKSGFSEFETYGNFVHLKYPDSYKLRELKSLRSGTKLTGPAPGPKDLYRLSGKYAYVSFELWTRPFRWMALSWRIGTALHYAFASLIGLFSKRVANRLKTVSDMFE